jgi:hypothetical protein
MRSMAQIWAGSRLLCRGSGPTAGCPGGVAGGLWRLAGGDGPAAARLGTSGGEGGADREKNCKGGAARPRPCLATGPADLVRGIGRGRPGGAGAQGPVGGGVASEVRAPPVRCLRPLPGYRARAPPEAAAHAGQRRITARAVGAAARAPPGAAPRRRCAWPGGAEGAGRAGARETGGEKAGAAAAVRPWWRGRSNPPWLRGRSRGTATSRSRSCRAGAARRGGPTRGRRSTGGAASATWPPRSWTPADAGGDGLCGGVQRLEREGREQAWWPGRGPAGRNHWGREAAPRREGWASRGQRWQAAAVGWSEPPAAAGKGGTKP